MIQKPNEESILEKGVDLPSNAAAMSNKMRPRIDHWV